MIYYRGAQLSTWEANYREITPEDNLVHFRPRRVLGSVGRVEVLGIRHGKLAKVTGNPRHYSETRGLICSSGEKVKDVMSSFCISEGWAQTEVLLQSHYLSGSGEHESQFY